MNKSFINKPNGIKPNVISKFCLGLLIAVMGLLAVPQPVLAASQSSYSEIFQNPTTTLDGKSVQTDLYFSQEDYWQVHKATLSLNFQISQLAARQNSDLTLALNGVKFESFRPSRTTGLQTKQVDLPLKLLQGVNHLTISGQVINDQAASLPQTPANWLTIYSGANVNYQYTIQQAETTVKSFYAHFTGMDTIANHNASIVVSNAATDGELTAAMYALGGIARLITTTDTKLPIVTTSHAQYQLIVARYDHLPAELKRQVAPDQKQGSLTAYTKGDTHYLIATATTDARLKRVAQFVANQELMQETSTKSEVIAAQTQIFTSVLQYQGHYQLADHDTTVTGAGHHSATFFVDLPTDRTNANGSKVKLHLSYAKNLNFDQALATVTVAGKKIGSHQLSRAHADDDTMVVSLPKSQALGNTFTISVDFDLQMHGDTDNTQTPWATIHSNSEADIQSTTKKALLFSNFPSTFIKHQSYANLQYVRPETMTAADYRTLTDLGNLLGNYAQSNTGKLVVTHNKPRASTLKNASVIAFGTPKQNPFIAQLNKKLYFQYTPDQKGFLSNEKLSIEKNFGQTIGTAQLLRSPYNDKKALLVVTGGTPEATSLGANQISTQASVSQYAGDAVVVDPNNQHYSYRFKKVAAINAHPSVKQVITKNSQLIIYLIGAFIAVALIILAVFLTVHKNLAKGGRAHE